MRRLHPLFCLLAILLLAATGLRAAEPAFQGPAFQGPAFQGDANAAVRLISAVEAVGDAGQVDLGLEFRFGPGWHGYWRQPGEAGVPPTLDWSRSANFAGAAIHWPAPRRETLLGIDTIAYDGELVLPVTVRLAEPGKPLAARLTLDYLACAEICVPHNVELALDLAAGPAVPGPGAGAIARHAARVPGSAEAAGLSVRGAAVSPKGLVVELGAEPPLVMPDMFLEGPDGLVNARPRPLGGGRWLVKTDGVETASLAGRPLTVTLVEGTRSAEFQVTPVAGGSAEGGGLVAALLAALLGGLILNLMPCVLPVLSLKLLGLVGAAGAGRDQARASFLATALGILASFALLAGALVAARGLGLTIGWGVQFQQPLFLAAMALLVALFAANLFGWIEFGLPARLAGLGTARARGPLLDAFLTGGLATLLATPCSAPFVGTAVGFALAGSNADIAAIFAGLALGFAAPYLVFAAWPGLGRLLPRPGAWMVRLRQGLGLVLAGTGLWLVSLLPPGWDWATGIAATALLLVLAMRAGGGWRFAPVLAMAGGTIVVLLLSGRPSAPASGPWRVWSEAAVAAEVAAGRTVLVDVTADWCLTCKVNKLAVLDRTRFAEQLSTGKVIGFKADWTRPDPAIAAYLARFGRYGIPFDAIYDPSRPNGQALPELLTEEILFDRLGPARPSSVAKNSN